MKFLFLSLFPLLMISCSNEPKSKDVNRKITGEVERLDPALDSIIDSNAKAEIIAEGFEWSEGPLWIAKHNMLLFSDVPKNVIYKWTEEKGKEVYLQPSGYTGEEPSKSKEPGSNGLTLDEEGNLVLCQHGNRQMAKMDAPIDKPAPKFITLADKYDNKRFSSPNDAAYWIGDLYFTDPPYGLPSQDDKDSTKEISFNGVYYLDKKGFVSLITDSLTRPNGLAFLPDGRLIVANSDPADPSWYIISRSRYIYVSDVALFYTAKGQDKSAKGSPDGLKIDSKGTVFATGPGGIWIFNSEGKLLGKIKLKEASSNVALSPDEKTLYITNDMQVLRIKMRK